MPCDYVASGRSTGFVDDDRQARLQPEFGDASDVTVEFEAIGRGHVEAGYQGRFGRK